MDYYGGRDALEETASNLKNNDNFGNHGNNGKTYENSDENSDEKSNFLAKVSQPETSHDAGNLQQCKAQYIKE